MLAVVRVTAGRWARSLLLVGTLFGLAAMHTLGHGTHSAGHVGAAGHVVEPSTRATLPVHATGLSMQAVGAAGHVVPVGAVDHVVRSVGVAGDAVALVRTVATTARQPRVYAEVPRQPVVVGAVVGSAPHGDGGGGLPGWGVCLAVLGALGMALLLTVALLAGVPAPGSRRRGPGAVRSPSRAPPPRSLGLRLATVSVLRR